MQQNKAVSNLRKQTFFMSAKHFKVPNVKDRDLKLRQKGASGAI